MRGATSADGLAFELDAEAAAAALALLSKKLAMTVFRLMVQPGGAGVMLTLQVECAVKRAVKKMQDGTRLPQIWGTRQRVEWSTVWSTDTLRRTLSLEDDELKM